MSQYDAQEVDILDVATTACPDALSQGVNDGAVEEKEPPPPCRGNQHLKVIHEHQIADHVGEEQEVSLAKASMPRPKRLVEAETSYPPDSSDGRHKRARVSAGSVVVEDCCKTPHNRLSKEQDSGPIEYWSEHKRWPGEYFEQATIMSEIIARKRSRPSRSRTSSDAASTSTGSSDQKPREEKSVDYKDRRYEILLSTKDSFMRVAPLGITDASKTMCKTLLENAQDIPENSLFRDDLFEVTIEKLRTRNEPRVIRDIALLIVPSAEILATYGAGILDCLIESVNEGWNDSIPLTKTRPQPDYAVGFRREAFNQDRLQKLRPFVGDVTDARNESYFMATFYMYFPFLTCEAKCGGAALDIADRQNAHSMTLAVRAVVELFRYVGREQELDREILAFSISHDNESVRIYGHYAVIEGRGQKYYRHSIHNFNFTALGGKEKWTAYKFTKNVYEVWMPLHFKRICAAIDAFPPQVSFDLTSQSELHFSDKSRLSQDMGSSSMAQSSTRSRSVQAEGDDQSTVIEDATATSNTSMNEVNDDGCTKRARKD